MNIHTPNIIAEEEKKNKFSLAYIKAVLEFPFQMKNFLF